MRREINSESGFVLVTVFLLILVGGILVTSYMSAAVFNIRFSADKINSERAYYAAQSGIQHLKADVNSFVGQQPQTFKLDNDDRAAEYTVFDQGKVGNVRTFQVDGIYNGKKRSIEIEYMSTDMSAEFKNGSLFQMVDGEVDFSGNDKGKGKKEGKDDFDYMVNTIGKEMVDYIGTWNDLKNSYTRIYPERGKKIKRFIDNEIVVVDFSDINDDEVQIGGNAYINNSVIIIGGAENSDSKTLRFTGGPSTTIKNSMFFLYDNIDLEVDGAPNLLNDRWDSEAQLKLDEVIKSSDGVFQNWSIQ